MNTTKIFTIFAIISAIGSAAIVLNILSPAAANALCTAGPVCGKIVDENPTTKNPHPKDELQGNPHQYLSGCSGNPHRQINDFASPECPGAQ